MILTLSRFPHVLGCLLLTSGLFLASGCSGGKPAGNVTGKVSFKGQPVIKAEVNFYMKERGQGAVARLDDTGAYKFDAPLEVGTYTVYLTPLPPEPVNPVLGQAKKPPINIPKKYQEPGTSELSFTVQAGRNDFPIDLTK